MFEKIKDRLIQYGDKTKRERLLNRYGCIQTCPYCVQIMQEGEGCSFAEHDKDPQVDILTCGVCAGKSLWHFALGFVYVGPYEAPKPKHDVWNYQPEIHAKEQSS